MPQNQHNRGRKSTVKGCRTNYDEDSPKHKNGFPEHGRKKDEGDCHSWLTQLHYQMTQGQLK